MDTWKYYAITHRYHTVCNPMSVDKMEGACDLLTLSAGSRVLDVGCGKAELLVRLAERYDISGVGVDLSPYAVRDARDKHSRRAPGADLQFICQDAAEYRPDELQRFNLTMCMGASWIWKGYRGTLLALGEMTAPNGWVLVGEPFWRKEPPQEYLDAAGIRREDSSTHHGNVRVGEEVGLIFAYTVVSSRDDWDRYEGLQWYAAGEYARRRPDDPDVGEILARCTRSRDTYLRWGRDYKGWALYLFRKP